ncbi:LptF/LptG family permease, partial [Helicobacter pylori]
MVKHYLFMAVSQVFFSFFLVLFFISSIVLLISIASVTLVIKVSFLDLVQLFLYSLPGTIFFILPITFFAACALGLSRLSYDHELLVFFSLGVSPKKMTKAFVPLSLLVSAILLAFSLILIPTSKSAYYGFLRQKKDKIDINIRAGEFGQKLGDWLVYVDKAENNSYDNLVLFSNKSLSQESFILAQKGNINNQNGVFELNLYNGHAYFTQGDKMRKVDFEELHLRNKLKSFNSNDAAYLQGTDYLGYWK